MDLLQGLLGGDQRQGLEDFAGRYEQGAPWDGVGDQEAVDRYKQVAQTLPPDEYEDAARQAFERLSPSNASSSAATCSSRRTHRASPTSTVTAWTTATRTLRSWRR